MVSYLKKLMQDPCSRFVSFFNVFVVVFYFFVFFLFFFFSFGPLWVLICGLKPKEAYLKSACTVRKFNEAHSEAIPEKKKRLDSP